MRKVMLVAGVLALAGGATPALAQIQTTMTSKVPVAAQSAPKITAPTATPKFKKAPLPAGTYTLVITTHCPAGSSLAMPPQTVTVTRNGDKIQFYVPVINMASLNAPGKLAQMSVEGTVDRDGDHNAIYAQAMTGAPGTDRPVIFTLRGPTDDYNQSASGTNAVLQCDAYTGAWENTTDQASFSLTPVN